MSLSSDTLFRPASAVAPFVAGIERRTMWEKKTTGLWLGRQLRMSETMANEIKDLADREYCKIEDQIRYLLCLGLEESKRRASRTTETTDERRPRT
jgi:hypothetical protein